MGAKIFYFVDHTANFAGNSGIQRVTRYLGRALGELGRDVVFVSWLGEARTATRSTDDELRRLARWNGPAFRSQGAAGHSLELDPADRDDLAGSWLIVPEYPYHSGCTALELIEYVHRVGLKIAFVFHDLVPVKMRGYGHLHDAHARDIRQMAAADMIMPVSRYSGDEIERHYARTLRLPATELPQIICCPLPEEFPGRPRTKVAAEPAGDAIKIISLGTIEPRKNHYKLLQAFNAVCAARPDLDVRLTLIGDHYPAVVRKLQRLIRHNPRIELARSLPDADVLTRYGECHFTVFPSVEEGYGLPVVESLWFGKPCLCANFGAMAEAAAGGGCLTVDTRSVKELSRGIELLATDPALRRRLAQEATSRPMRSWRDYADTVLSELDRHRSIRQAYYWVDFTVHHPINTGVQRVTRGLARSLENMGIELEYVQWNYRDGRFAPPDDAQRRHLANWNGPAYQPSRPLSEDYDGKWLIVPEILSPPEPTPADVIRYARALGMKIAFLFYDLIPLKHAAMFPLEFTDGFVDCWKMMRAADAILPISRAAGDDLRGFYAQNGGETGAAADTPIIPCPLPGEFVAAPRARRAREREASSASVLCVGTIDPRKNQLQLVEALEQLRRGGQADGISLTIAGSSQSYPELAAEVQRRISNLPGAVFLDHVDDATLQELYARCDFTVYASYEEGFGLPVMESLWNARPCLCHNAGAIAEVAAAGGCHMVDMRDVDALRAGVLRLARDHDLYRRLAQEAVNRPIKTWVEYAAEVAGILAQRMRRPRPRPMGPVASRLRWAMALIADPARIYAGIRRRALKLRLSEAEIRPLPEAEMKANAEAKAGVGASADAVVGAPGLDNSPRMRRILRIVADLWRRPLSECRTADLGCAHGYYAIELARRGAKSLGIEGRASWVQQAQSSMAGLGLSNGEVVQDDVRHFTKEKYGSFDIILCLGILYHLDAPDLFELLAHVADCCSDFAVIDTQIALKPVQAVEWRQKRYWGWAYQEHPDNADPASKEANLGASLNNNYSFWLTRASLLNALREVGFTSVYECANPMDAMYLDGEMKLHSDYITLVAVKGAPILEETEIVPAEVDWPEDPKPFFLRRPYVAPWS